MRFGKTLREKTLKEWRFYSVDYKALKQTLKGDIDREEFFRLLDVSKDAVSKFYSDKENWAVGYIETLEDRVDSLRAKASLSPSQSLPELVTEHSASSSDDSSVSSSEEGTTAGKDMISTQSPTGVSDYSKINKEYDWLKEQYRRTGKCEHFNAFIYAKKSIATFDRELELLSEFLALNKTAFSKILKKFDKRAGTTIRDEKMTELQEKFGFLNGEKIAELREYTAKLLADTEALKPSLPEGWENRKVYTIGCFDLFHRGHQNVLESLREFGYYIVAGIHDDESYFQLKNKYTIDNLETRMENVKPFVDQLFVIPSTDPLVYIKSMVSTQDIETGACCYARGDDMLQFPGREWVESVMPVHFVPRTEGCSSTLIRTIYHSDNAELRKKAAFAKTRYDGKPVDEDGNVLKLKA
jgi:cytidyltransferase-like protein